MEKKEFKAESKRLLDMMINSIYTHKEIFLRELISNASDATDKLYYNAMQTGNAGLSRDDLAIKITPDKEARTLTISDIPAQTYTGSALTPGVTVSYQGTALTASQYDVQYGSNINK